MHIRTYIIDIYNIYRDIDYRYGFDIDISSHVVAFSSSCLPFSLLCLFFGGCFTDHHKCLKNPPAIPKEYPYTSEILKEYCDAEVAEFTKRFGSG